LEHADPLHKVTILPTGMALGVTHQLPTEERHIYKREYIADSLVVRLGGRVAEELMFGHRTTGAGMFRHIETVKLGSTFSLRGTNGHWYNYRVVYVGVTPPRYSAISNITHYFPPVTAQLVACSLQNGQPTSLQWRITVTGRLVSVT